MKSKLLYCLEFIWFYTMCIIAIPMSPFIFVWAVYMYAKQDYEENHRSRKDRV
jgi:hypothetical protein